MSTRERTTKNALIVAILLLAAALHLLGLQKAGFANLYYAATVRSMLAGWQNFFFASFDPGGFVTVDKPPLGFWVQAGSAALFGFTGLSLLLPQALAGIASVALIYHLVKHSFGVPAALVAALVLALTPISVAANRNNTQDSLVVLACLLAAAAALRSVEGGGWRWLLVAAALVGAGFEIKMMQAYLVLPAVFGLYLLIGEAGLCQRVLHLAAAGLVLAVVSLAWPVAVDLTPPAQRPYVGSSASNSVIELIVGHNGLSRLLPGGLRQLVGGRGAPQPQNPARGQPQTPGLPGQGLTPGAGPINPPPPGPGIQGEIGAPGILRLFNRQLGGQASWLLPLAGLGLLAGAWQERPARRSRRLHGLLLWSMWLAPQAVFFSYASLYHRYYLEMMSPGIAALVGVAVTALWADYRKRGWRGWLLPAALLASAAVQALLLRPFPEWDRRLTPLICALVVVAAGALLALRRWSERRLAVALSGAALMLGGAALLLAPAAWAVMPVVAVGNVGLPAAGPEALAFGQPQRPPSRTKLTDYLERKRQGERFLVATQSANTAAPIILVTGQPVMAFGGFSGGDRILTQRDLEQVVIEQAVRFFLLGGNSGAQPDLARWIETRCREVAESEWQGQLPPPGRQTLPAPGVPLRLYDCAAFKR